MTPGNEMCPYCRRIAMAGSLDFDEAERKLRAQDTDQFFAMWKRCSEMHGNPKLGPMGYRLVCLKCGEVTLHTRAESTIGYLVELMDCTGGAKIVCRCGSNSFDVRPPIHEAAAEWHREIRVGRLIAWREAAERRDAAALVMEEAKLALTQPEKG